MLLKPPYRYQRVDDTIPNRELFQVLNADGLHVANAWVEDTAQAIVEALNTMEAALQLTAENEELRKRIETLVLE